MKYLIRTLIILLAIGISIPIYSQDYFDKGDSLENLNDFKGAVYFYSKSINSKEDTVDAFYRRGLLHLQLENFNGAIQDLKYYLNQVKGREYGGPSLDVRGFTRDQVMISHWELAVCYLKLGNKEEACTHLTKSGEFGNDDAFDYIKKICN